MENIVNIPGTSNTSWLTNRCRAIIHHIFAQLEGAQIEVVEGDTVLRFGKTDAANKAPLKAKITIHGCAREYMRSIQPDRVTIFYSGNQDGYKQVHNRGPTTQHGPALRLRSPMSASSANSSA